MPRVLTHEQKQLAFRLRARGWRLDDIAREIGCSAQMVSVMVNEGRCLSGVPDDWEPRPGCLTITDREEILVGIRAGATLSRRRPSAWPAALDGHAGGRRQRWPGPLLGLGRAPAGTRASTAPQAVQAPGGPAARRGDLPPEAAVVAAGDRATLTARLPRRSGDAGEPRDDLPVAVRAGQGRAAP